jgi:hypothetical protein
MSFAGVFVFQFTVLITIAGANMFVGRADEKWSH